MQEDIYFSSFIQANEKDYEKDLAYIKSCYPKESYEYNRIIEEECDKLEYEGSPMYAELPDKATIGRIAQQILSQIGGQQQSQGLLCLISTMLCNEMYIRRCRKGNHCRMFGNI